ncbi:hypothetical protein ABBQ32_000737 [Trebouxia sp. C0010 RCD-2024]
MGLLFIIPPHGPKRGEPNDFQPFLDIIADQLRHAYWYGIEGCVDGSWRFKPAAERATLTETFTCKVKLLMGINDRPGWSVMTRVSKNPSRVGACYSCHQEGLKQGGTQSLKSTKHKRASTTPKDSLDANLVR